LNSIPTFSDIFNTEPLETNSNAIVTAPLVVNDTKEQDQEDDYQLARKTMRGLLQKGETAIEEILTLAKSSEHPRTYEVTGQLIKTLSDVSKDLIGLQKQIKDINKDTAAAFPQIGNQTNNVFLGSTHELMQMIKRKSAELDDDTIIDQ
jgi:hypothetical protein